MVGRKTRRIITVTTILHIRAHRTGVTTIPTDMFLFQRLQKYTFYTYKERGSLEDWHTFAHRVAFYIIQTKLDYCTERRVIEK